MALAPTHTSATVDCNWNLETDARLVCTSDTDGDTLTQEDVPDLPSVPGNVVYETLVIDVHDDEVDRVDARVSFDADDDDGSFSRKVEGDLDGSGEDGLRLTFENLPDIIDVTVELAADIDVPTDGEFGSEASRRHGAVIANWSDSDFAGVIEVINTGSIRTTGDGRGYAFRVDNNSEHADAEAIAVNKGTIETRGTAQRGMTASIEGSGAAVAINEGTVTTRGGPDDNYDAHAVLASSDGAGTATAINVSGATITTEGDGALGLRAETTGSGTATATNEAGATVTTEGDGASGLRATVTGSGTATATNEAGATVTTTGDDARGVNARVQDGAGTAIATNRGSILTTGDDTGTRAYGLYAQAFVDEGSVDGAEVRAVNSGMIETRGTGARGIRANVGGSGTAVAINEGSVTTKGATSESGFSAHGVQARVAEGGTATATNANGATITTTGDGARGLVAWGGSGTAVATNEGSVTTKGALTESGFSARGVQAGVEGEGTATATNANGATITTTGDGATGLRAGGESGTAVATNEGSVTTGDRQSESGVYAHGVYALVGEGGTATATNANGAAITTTGDGAQGLWARGGSGGTAVATNEGSVTTEGARPPESRFHANGVYALAGEGGKATATNANGAAITTTGDGARGLAAWGGLGGTAVATNEGSVTTKGALTETGFSARGVQAGVQGAGTATATNANGATITTTGDGARGLRAWGGLGGTAVATNEGSVTTGDTQSESGVYANGVVADVEEGGTATATNANGATVTTTGDAAAGVFARVDDGAGKALATNRGSILTTGDDTGAFRAYGLYAKARVDEGSVGGAEVRAVNSGMIETRGTGARGIRALVEGSGTAVAINEGSVTTQGAPSESGFNAHGVQADVKEGGTASATNANGAAITTTGDGARGLVAQGDGLATAVATNEGSVTTGGGSSESGLNAHGVVAITADGDALVTNRGEVHVRGSSAIGLWAHTTGAGEAAVVVNGGTVRATHDSATNDDEDGIGVFAETESGTLRARIQGGSLIEAPVAARFRGGHADVIVDGSTIRGAIEFDRFNDTLSAIDSTFAGDIDFGEGLDTLVIQSGVFEGTVTGVTEMYKRGSGVVRFGSDVTFAGSSATIEEGALRFAGDFDLGPEGTMTIYDQARVSALLTDENKDDPPRIIAGGGIIAQDADGNPAALELHLQADETVDDQTRSDQATIERMAQNVIAEGTPIRSASSEVVLKTEVQEGESETIGSIMVKEDGTRGVAVVEADAVLRPEPEPEPETPTQRRGSSGGGNDAVVLGGGALLLMLLLSPMDDVLDPDESKPGEAKSTVADRGVSFTPLPGTGQRLTHWIGSGRDGSWSLALSGKAPRGTAGASAMGFNARLGRGFSIGVSASPDRSMSLRQSDAVGRLDGGRYALRGRWRGETWFAGAGIRRGEWRGRTTFANPVAGGGLTGAFDMRQTYAHAGVGASFDFGGMRVRPSATLFSGQVERDAHTARGSAFTATLPRIAQGYRGWRAGLRLSSSDWLGGVGTLRWRPALDLSAMRTRTDAAAFTLKQSARTGALSFSSLAQAETMPRTLLGIGMSADAIAFKKWRLRLGYGTVLVAGKPEHGVVAGVQVRF